jgi:glycosyltransferase involved in cell wall biosynthesis
MDQVDRIWVMSEWGRRVLIEDGFDGSRVDAVPGGFDPEIFSPQLDEAHWEAAPFRFLTVGKFEARKGTAEMIRAYAEEFRPDEPVEFWVHAHNPFVADFDLGSEIQRLGLDRVPRLRLLARRSDPHQMADVYRSCHCFVSAMRAEGWGLPLTEALACGLPAIATDYGPYREFTSREDCFLLPVDHLEPTKLATPGVLGEWAIPDPRALRRLMREAYQNRDELQRMGRAAARRLRDAWTWDHAARKAHALLRPRAERPAATGPTVPKRRSGRQQA